MARVDFWVCLRAFRKIIIVIKHNRIVNIDLDVLLYTTFVFVVMTRLIFNVTRNTFIYKSLIIM